MAEENTTQSNTTEQQQPKMDFAAALASLTPEEMAQLTAAVQAQSKKSASYRNPELPHPSEDPYLHMRPVRSARFVELTPTTSQTKKD